MIACAVYFYVSHLEPSLMGAESHILDSPWYEMRVNFVVMEQSLALGLNYAVVFQLLNENC